MMRLLTGSCALLLLFACSEQNDVAPAVNHKNETVSTAEKNDDSGAELYAHYCLPCHAAGPGHPGTMRLAERLGAGRAVLDSRNDLQAAYIKTIVRQGIQLMPPFRPTEISDSELDALTAYLTGGNK